MQKIEHDDIAYYWQPLGSEQEEGETIEARRVVMPGLCGLNRIIDGYDPRLEPRSKDWDVPPTAKKILAGHTVYLAGTMTICDGAPLLRINVPNTSAESYLTLRGDVPGAPGGIIDILPDAEPPGQEEPIPFTQHALRIGSPFTRVSSLKIWRQIANASEVETGCPDAAHLHCVGVGGHDVTLSELDIRLTGRLKTCYFPPNSDRECYFSDDVIKLTRKNDLDPGADRLSLLSSYIEGDPTEVFRPPPPDADGARQLLPTAHQVETTTDVYIAGNEHGLDAAGGYDQGTVAFNTFAYTRLAGCSIKGTHATFQGTYAGPAMAGEGPNWGGACEYWTIHDNLFYKCGQGVAVGSPAGGDYGKPIPVHLARHTDVYNNIIVGAIERGLSHLGMRGITVEGALDTRIYANTLVDCYIRFVNGKYTEEDEDAENGEGTVFWLHNEDAEVYNNIVQNRWEEYHRHHHEWGIDFASQKEYGVDTCPTMRGHFYANNNLYQAGEDALKFRIGGIESNPCDQNCTFPPPESFLEWQACGYGSQSTHIPAGGSPWILAKAADHTIENLSGYRLSNHQEIKDAALGKAREGLWVREKGTEDRVLLDWAFRGEAVGGARNIGAFQKFSLTTLVEAPRLGGSKLRVRGLSPGSCGAIAWSRIPGKSPVMLVWAGEQSDKGSWGLEEPAVTGCVLENDGECSTTWFPDPGVHFVQALEIGRGGAGEARFSDVQMVSVDPIDRNLDLLLTFEGQ